MVDSYYSSMISISFVTIKRECTFFENINQEF